MQRHDVGRYPHLFFGSVSSSAPVWAQLEMRECEGHSRSCHFLLSHCVPPPFHCLPVLCSHCPSFSPRQHTSPCGPPPIRYMAVVQSALGMPAIGGSPDCAAAVTAAFDALGAALGTAAGLAVGETAILLTLSLHPY